MLVADAVARRPESPTGAARRTAGECMRGPASLAAEPTGMGVMKPRAASMTPHATAVARVAFTTNMAVIAKVSQVLKSTVCPLSRRFNPRANTNSCLAVCDPIRLTLPSRRAFCDFVGCLYNNRGACLQ
eukprot:1884685-Rhodomonas_salina.1